MSNSELREKVLKLLKRRYKSGYIPRKDTYESYKHEVMASKIHKKTLEKYLITFKALKTLDVKLSKSKFKEIHQKAATTLNQEIKITVFGYFQYTYKSAKGKVWIDPDLRREAIDMFVMKNKNDKRIN